MKYTFSLLLAGIVFSGCLSFRHASLLQREYGEFEWIDLPTLDVHMLICTPKPDVVLTKQNNVAIQAHQLPGEDPGYGYMFFIALRRVSGDDMRKKWEKSEEESESFRKWLGQRHETCALQEDPWITTMRRDIPLADGDWIIVIAIIHAYNIKGQPHMVSEDIDVAKRMIDSIEPKKKEH